VVLLSDWRPRSYSGLERNKAEYADAADRIREKDRVLEKLGQKVGALKAPLQAIVKQYPPFGPEDKERIKFLKQFNGLRKQIDAVTFPRPQDGAAQEAPAPLPPLLPTSVSDSQINDHLKDLDVTGAALDRQRAALASDAAAYVGSTAFSVAFSGHLGAVSPGSPLASRESAALQKSVEIGQQFAENSGQGVTASNLQSLKLLG